MKISVQQHLYIIKQTSFSCSFFCLKSFFCWVRKPFISTSCCWSICFWHFLTSFWAVLVSLSRSCWWRFSIRSSSWWNCWRNASYSFVSLALLKKKLAYWHHFVKTYLFKIMFKGENRRKRFEWKFKHQWRTCEKLHQNHLNSCFFLN